MATLTPNYSLQKPDDGGDDEVWGVALNASLDIIDTTMKANEDAILLNTTALASLVVGTDVQAYDAALTSIAALGTAANKMIYSTGVDTFAETDITVQARQLLDDGSYTDMRATLELGSAATRDIDNTEDLTVAPTDVLSRGGTATAIENALTVAPSEIGSYVWAYYTTNANVTFGTTVAGSSLRPTSGVYKGANFSSSYGTSTFASGSALSGTYQCCGVSDYVTGVNPTYYGATLWQRIA